MRHHKKGRAFGLVDKGRTALIRSLARSLIIREKITTSEAKAKELRPFVEKLVTKGKADSVANRRLVLARLGSGRASVEKIFKTLAPRYEKRAGGYTRITKLSPRIKDGSKQAVIEFV
jgi:large subunit ribosomal protein L17